MYNHFSTSCRFQPSFQIHHASSSLFQQTRPRNWAGSLSKMAKFSSFCESLLERRKQISIADRGARWYKAVAHHLSKIFFKWRKQIRVKVMNRLLEKWFLHLNFQKWKCRVQQLNQGQLKLEKLLKLWYFARERAGFTTWKRRTNRVTALKILMEAVRISILRAHLNYWRRRNILLRWKFYVHTRFFLKWKNWHFKRYAKRLLTQRIFNSLYTRTIRDVFTVWYSQYLLLQDIYEKQNRWWGTSLDRCFKRRQLRCSFKTWYSRTQYLTNVMNKINRMLVCLERFLVKSGWKKWRRSIFTWGRKRRKACGCAKALAKSRRGLGWCYTCSSTSHLFNRIEDSVELIEGMSLRLAKTALSTKDQNSKSQHRSSIRKRRTKNQRNQCGEAALNNVMRLLQVDRYISSNSNRINLSSIKETSTIVDRAVTDLHHNCDTNGQLFDLELNWKGENGLVERTFVSRSARDSFERFQINNPRGNDVKREKEISSRKMPVFEDGVIGARNRW